MRAKSQQDLAYFPRILDDGAPTSSSSACTTGKKLEKKDETEDMTSLDEPADVETVKEDMVGVGIEM